MPTAASQQQLLRDEAAAFLGRVPTDIEMEMALPRAKRKLHRIIEREGDAGGMRLQPWYLGKLIEEAISERAFSEFTIMHSMIIEVQRQIAKSPNCTSCSGCQEIKKAAPLETTQPHQNYITGICNLSIQPKRRG